MIPIKSIRRFLLASLLIISFTTKGQSWQSLLQGVQTNGDVRAFAYDSTNNLLYIGGFFSRVNYTDANNIAMWNGNAWLPLGQGVNNIVEALYIHNGELY